MKDAMNAQRNPGGVERCIPGDWRKYVSEHYRLLYAFALETTDEADSAQRLVLEAFQAVLPGAPAGRPSSDVRAQLLRHIVREFAHSATGDHSESPVDASATTDLPNVDVSTALNREWLAQCLSTLRTRDRQLACLAYIGLMPPSDIAYVMGDSASEVMREMVGVQMRLLACLAQRSRQAHVG